MTSLIINSNLLKSQISTFSFDVTKLNVPKFCVQHVCKVADIYLCTMFNRRSADELLNS